MKHLLYYNKVKDIINTHLSKIKISLWDPNIHITKTDVNIHTFSYHNNNGIKPLNTVDE